LVTGYVSGEVPLVEGVQMMGVYDSLAQAQKAYAAWTKRVILPNAKKIGGKPVASFAFANMYLWSKFPVNSLEDLKRKKIRIFSTAQANYLKALGAEPVSIPLAEVYPALERGVVDAVITGPDVANRTKLYEIVGYVTDLMFGPGAGWVVISDHTWSSLSPDLRSAVEGLLPELQRRGWDLAFQENEENLKAVMAHGVKATIPVKPEWRDKLQEIARKVVIPAWATRAGPDGVAAFNEAIAPIVGVTATK
jgi:TRAP-type C4-dicarboxylate transport system substrate-binding protein